MPGCKAESRLTEQSAYRKEIYLHYTMADDDIVYGLGEANRGVKQAGVTAISATVRTFRTHTEDKLSLYGAHNFIVVWGKQTFGMFF